MTRAVSIVIPSLEDTELFVRHLPPLFAEVERRALGDEVIVVDDTGESVLEGWFAQHFSEVRVVTNLKNTGFAGALLAGVDAARHELVFFMNPDVKVHPRFLDPLVACLDDAKVAAVVPRILLGGEAARVESLTELVLRDGVIAARQRGLEGDAQRFLAAPRPIAYPVGGACLCRKAEFMAGGGFDELFEPFYWEDVDYGWCAWRAGQQVLYQPASVVEHHHRGTIGKRIPRELVRAAIEKNRLLFHWKHLDDPALLSQHVTALYRWAVDAWLEDEHAELIWLTLALDEAQAALAAREALGPAKRSFAEIAELTNLDRDEG